MKNLRMPEKKVIEYEDLLQIIKRFTKNQESISLNSHLELDLGLDSLKKIELIIEIEKALAMKIPEGFIVEINYVRELLEKLNSLSYSNYVAEEFYRNLDDILLEPPEEELLQIKKENIYLGL